MAIWETTSRYTTWASNGELLRRTNVIEKISDEKSGEQTFEVNEAVKLTFRGSTLERDGHFLGTVTVNGVDYPVVSFSGSRFIVGLDSRVAGVPSRLDDTALDASTFTVCFFPGTLIATPSGERKVEELASGDPVLNGASGAIPATWLGRKFARAVSVNWIGWQTVSTLFGPAERLMPVRFSAGSLGGGGGGNPLCRIAI